MNTSTHTMQRTQVYLPDGVLQEVQNLAQQKKVSMAGIIRDFVIQGVRAHRHAAHQPRPLFKILDKIKYSGDVPKDLSAHIDQYLYGQ